MCSFSSILQLITTGVIELSSIQSTKTRSRSEFSLMHNYFNKSALTTDPVNVKERELIVIDQSLLPCAYCVNDVSLGIVM